MNALTSQQRREMYRQEVRRVLHTFRPNCPGNRYSGQQVARAKGIASKNLAPIFDT